MKNALEMSKASEKSNENNALDIIKMMVIKDTIKLVERSIEEAASFARTSWEDHIHESALEAVHSTFVGLGYSVHTIGDDPIAGSAHSKTSW